jgi:hypothetical protein
MPPGYPIGSLAIRSIRPAIAGYQWVVFVFFSNNLGCLGSLLVSLIGTLVLLLVLGVIRIG